MAYIPCMSVTVRPGSPFPLGVHFSGSGVNVAVYSSVADQVLLCLFDADGTETRLPLPGLDAGVWHGHLDGIEPGQEYGFRVKGPYDPAAGQRCNPAKLLLDPYAVATTGDVSFGPSIYGHDLDNPGLASDLDSAFDVPRGLMLDRLHRWVRTRRVPYRPASPDPPGTCPIRCSTRSTSRVSPRVIPTSLPRSAGPMPAWRTRLRSHI